MFIRIDSQLVPLTAGNAVEVEVPDGAELLFQTVDRYNQGGVEVITVVAVDGASVGGVGSDG